MTMTTTGSLVSDIRILALDISMSSTGYCIMKGAEVDAFGSVPTTPKDGSWMDRVDKVLEHLNEFAEGPFDLIVYEKPIAYGRGNSVTLHMFSGAIVFHFHEWYGEATPIYDVPPSTIKKSFTGSGRAKKPEMIAEAKRRGFPVANSDEADAIALAHYVMENPQ